MMNDIITTIEIIDTYNGKSFILEILNKIIIQV
jgi:hypothetical protein